MKLYFKSLIILIIFLFFSLSCVLAATYIVDSNGDADDGLPYTEGDLTNTLRKCIRLANAGAGADIINFNNDYTIAPASVLPTITEQLTIDASVGSRTIILDGPGGSYVGLDIDTTNCIIKNLQIKEFTDGIYINGDAYDSNTIDGCKIYSNTSDGIEINAADSCVIKGCYIGTSDGSTAAANTTYGINLNNGTCSNIIGGSTAGERNIVSGQSGTNDAGIYITGSTSSNNIIKGNYIGTNSAGDAAVANCYGICITGDAQSNTIGGSTSDERNVISGNVGGVWITDSATPYNTSYNKVIGNYIGLNAVGTSALANTHTGVYVGLPSSNTIGGSTAGERNFICGNTNSGIWIEKANSNKIIGNYIGLNVDGAAAPNGTYGISISNTAQENTIGGSTSGERNIISGHSGVNDAGILLGSGGYHIIKGNYIGTNPAGDTAIANYYGIYMTSSTSSTIGGSTAGERNIISGNTLHGVYIKDSGNSNNIIKGNYIGLNDAGSGALANSGYGIYLYNSTQSNTIGGAAAGEGNTIANNGSADYPDNVRVDGSNTKYNKISCNSIYDGYSTGKGIKLINSAQESISAPTITSASTTTVIGTGGTNSGRVEVFIVDSQSSNEGKTFVGSCTANADGTWSCSVSGASSGNYVNATCTNTSGSTSEFSSNTIVFGPLHHFNLSIATPQTNGVAFTGTCTLTAKDENDITITTFNASANNVTMSNDPAGGTISGLSGGNKLTGAADFSSGVANLTTLGMKFTGTSGSYTFTATSADLKAGTSGSVTINVGALDHFHFSLTSPQKNTVAFTGTNTLTAQDAGHNVVTTFDASTNNVTITATPDDGAISGLSGGNKLNNASDFVDGVANVTSELTFTGGLGNHTFTATSATSKTGTSGTVNMLANVPSKLVITTAVQAINTNTASAIITVQARDDFNNPVDLDSNQVVNLTSSSTAGRFDTSATGNFDGSITSVTILSGASSANFYYKDSRGGTPTITCTPSGQSWTAATQTETINAPANSGTLSGTVIKNDIKYARAKVDIYQLTDVRGQTTEDGTKATPVATVYTDNNGDYGADLSTNDYVAKFTDITGYNTFQVSVTLTQGTTTTINPQFIDPAGVVYNSATKTSLQGATVTITETNTGVVGYTVVTGADGRYQWLAAQARRYTITVTPPASYTFPSTTIQELTAPDPLPGPAQNDLNGLATGRYYLNFRFAATSGDLINNDIPLDMGNLQNLRLQKTINKKRAFIGDVIVYTITVENPNNFTVSNFYIEDLPAPQIKYLDGSSFYNGGTITPTNKSPLVFNGLSIAGNSQATLSYKSVIGSHVQLEKAYTNRAIAKNTYGSEISNLATAQIKIVHDPLFDEATVIGVVFEDKNRNGEFDADEKGIPHAQLYEVTGICITADENGKWHLSALKPNKIYLFKIFPYTLPGGAEGWEYTTDNPRWLKVTRGSLYEINFGVVKNN